MTVGIQLSLECAEPGITCALVAPIVTAKKTTATTVVNAIAIEKYFISISITSKIFKISK